MSRDTEAGKYRDFVAVEAPTRTANGYGEMVDSWSRLFTRWARIEGKQIDEVVNGDKIRSVGTHQVWIRPYTQSLTNNMRLVWLSGGSRVMDIISVTEVGNKEGNKLVCKERAS